MVTFLITSFFILAFLAVAAYFWQKPASTTETEALLPPRQYRGLFIDGIPEGQIAEDNAEVIATALRERTALLDRAANGEKSALQHARNISNSVDSGFYEEVLNCLVESANSGPKLLSLVSYVARNELPVNQKLAERFITSCKSEPGQSSAAKMLHIAALSDDANLYQTAVETALESWRNGLLPEVSPQELLAILEGEFWLLSAHARSSGAGFLLKRTLSSARRELETAHNNQTSLD